MQRKNQTTTENKTTQETSSNKFEDMFKANQEFKSTTQSTLTKSVLPGINTAGRLSAQLNEFKDAVKEYYKNNNVPAKVTTFTKVIVVSFTDGKNIYATMNYPVSEKDGLTVQSIISSIERRNKVVLPDGKVSHAIPTIKPELAKILATAHGIELTDGYKFSLLANQISDNLEITESNVERKAISWAMQPYLIMLKNNGKRIEPDVTAIVQKFKEINKRFSLELVNVSGARDTNDRPIPAMFRIDLTETSANDDNLSYFTESNAVTTAFGSVLSVPVKKEIAPQYYGVPQQQQTMNGYSPVIVTSMVETSTMTLGYTLMAIGTTAALTNNYAWAMPIKADLKRAKQLIKFSNIKFEKNETPDSLIIKSHSMNPPSIAVDIPVNQDTIPAYHAIMMSVGSNVEKANIANNILLGTLDELFDGKFTQRYKGKMFVKSILLPIGYFSDGGVEKSIDEVLDPAYIIEKRPNDYLEFLTDLSAIATGELDGFKTVITILDSLGINAVITGTKRRCYMSGDAFKALVDTMTIDGNIQPVFDFKQVDYQNRPDLTEAGKFFGNIGISGNVDFGSRYGDNMGDYTLYGNNDTMLY